MDAIIRSVEQLGGTIEASPGDRSGRLGIHVAGETCNLSIAEHCRVAGPRKPTRKPDRLTRIWESQWHYCPSGMLAIGNYGTDDETHRLEDTLNTVVIVIIQHAGRSRFWRRESQARISRIQEQQRIREEREGELLLRGPELQQRQAVERSRLDRLMQGAKAWHDSEILRGYIDAAEKTFVQRHGPVDPASEFGQWLVWASQQADRMDPLMPSPPSILD